MRKGLMLALLSLVLVVPAAAQQPVAKPSVLFFTAKWCEYCQKIKPEVARFKAAGYDIREIDVEGPAERPGGWTGPQLQDYYNIKTLPSFVAVLPISASQINELGRMPEGVKTPANILQFMKNMGLTKPVTTP